MLRTRLIPIALLGLFPALMISGCGEEAPDTHYLSEGDDQEWSEQDLWGVESLNEDEILEEIRTEVRRQNDEDLSDRFAAAGLLWDVPDDWEQRESESEMRVAVFTLSEAEYADLERAEVVFFHFGPEGAGTVDANIERWARMIVGEHGRPLMPSIETFPSERAGLYITLTASTGTYLSGTPGSEPTPKKNWTLLGAVVQDGPIGPVYLRMVGPEPVVTANYWRFVDMLRTVRIDPAHVGDRDDYEG